MKFGSLGLVKIEITEIVSIPGLRGREPKEISLKLVKNNSHVCG
jgi:hypothetical protein